MRIAVCDDQPEQLKQICDWVSEWPNCPGDLTLHPFDNGDSLLRAHQARPFDLVLLDVMMPLLNGMETAKEIRLNDQSVKLIFLTATADFAVDAFTVKASNYLLKPVVPQKLYQCLDEITEELRSSAKKICIKGLHALHRIAVADIEYIESQNKKILFVLSNGQSILSGEPLYTYEEKLTLEDGFFKCSRSFIVNINRIVTFTAKEIRTHSGARISISRSLHREFENAYFSVLFGKDGDAL